MAEMGSLHKIVAGLGCSAVITMWIFLETGFIPAVLITVVCGVAIVYVIVDTIWRQFQRWLGWTRLDH
jgi:hypothetical protein